MIPIDEGNDKCRKCKHYDLSFGCIPTYSKDEFPPCGRDVIVEQEYLKKLFKNQRRRWFK